MHFLLFQNAKKKKRKEAVQEKLGYKKMLRLSML